MAGFVIWGAVIAGLGIARLCKGFGLHIYSAAELRASGFRMARAKHIGYKGTYREVNPDLTPPQALSSYVLKSLAYDR